MVPGAKVEVEASGKTMVVEEEEQEEVVPDMVVMLRSRVVCYLVPACVCESRF